MYEPRWYKGISPHNRSQRARKNSQTGVARTQVLKDLGQLPFVVQRRARDNEIEVGLGSPLKRWWACSLQMRDDAVWVPRRTTSLSGSYWSLQNGRNFVSLKLTNSRLVARRVDETTDDERYPAASKDNAHML